MNDRKEKDFIGSASLLEELSEIVDVKVVKYEENVYSTLGKTTVHMTIEIPHKEKEE